MEPMDMRKTIIDTTFLKFDVWLKTIFKSTWILENNDSWNSHFLNLTGDIGDSPSWAPERERESNSLWDSDVILSAIVEGSQRKH